MPHFHVVEKKKQKEERGDIEKQQQRGLRKREWLHGRKSMCWPAGRPVSEITLDQSIPANRQLTEMREFSQTQFIPAETFSWL